VNWIFANEIEQCARAIQFHEGDSTLEMRRARAEFIEDKIMSFKTMDELRDILRYLAKEAGIT
jgi:hypothetical protein